jgi:hypothetical protein
MALLWAFTVYALIGVPVSIWFYFSTKNILDIPASEFVEEDDREFIVREIGIHIKSIGGLKRFYLLLIFLWPLLIIAKLKKQGT